MALKHLSLMALGLLYGWGWPETRAQTNIWTDTFNGGVITGSFSIGDHSSGIGVIFMDLPVGATVRKAILYSVQIGNDNGDALSFDLGTNPLQLDPSTAIAPNFNSLYGPVILHAVDVTDLIDPTLFWYQIDLRYVYTNYKEFILLVEYELPGVGPITVDVFRCEEDSQLEEPYTFQSTQPMANDQPIALGIMGSYACCEWYDYEMVTVNGTYLGKYWGSDFNSTSGNMYGASATFHYANGIFEGRGGNGMIDDDPDVAIDGADALSDLASLIDHGDQVFHIDFAHTPTTEPNHQRDNIVNFIVVAYASTPCDNRTELLGPDTLLCPGETLILDATREGATYAWQDGSTDATYTVTGPGTYIVQWQHPECTWGPDTVVVDYVSLPSVDLGPTIRLCPDDEAVPLDAVLPDGAVGIWADGSTDLPRWVEEEGMYVLNVSILGCTTADSVLVERIDCSYHVEMPNVFTPNGDGSNNVFKPIIREGRGRFSMVIYNRWGQEVHHMSNLDDGWNGRTKSGGIAPEGVYYWILRFTPDRPVEEAGVQYGTVTLLR